ncbi:hypothetical protein ACSSZE_16035 [Acidithiobacillus caldus]
MSIEENTTQEEQVVPEEPHFVEPSKLVSYAAKGEEYLEFQWISDRLVFPGKIAARQRDRENGQAGTVLPESQNAGSAGKNRQTVCFQRFAESR